MECLFFQVALVVKNVPASAGDARDVSLIPGAGNGNPLQDSCLEHPKAIYNQQKQDRELTVAQIMNSLLPDSELH